MYIYVLVVSRNHTLSPCYLTKTNLLHLLLYINAELINVLWKLFPILIITANLMFSFFINFEHLCSGYQPKSSVSSLPSQLLPFAFSQPKFQNTLKLQFYRNSTEICMSLTFSFFLFYSIYNAIIFFFNLLIGYHTEHGKTKTKPTNISKQIFSFKFGKNYLNCASLMRFKQFPEENNVNNFIKPRKLAFNSK